MMPGPMRVAISTRAVRMAMIQRSFFFMVCYFTVVSLLWQWDQQLVLLCFSRGYMGPWSQSMVFHTFIRQRRGEMYPLEVPSNRRKFGKGDAPVDAHARFFQAMHQTARGLNRLRNPNLLGSAIYVPLL